MGRDWKGVGRGGRREWKGVEGENEMKSDKG